MYPAPVHGASVEARPDRRHRHLRIANHLTDPLTRNVQKTGAVWSHGDGRARERRWAAAMPASAVGEVLSEAFDRAGCGWGTLRPPGPPPTRSGTHPVGDRQLTIPQPGAGRRTEFTLLAQAGMPMGWAIPESESRL